MEVKGERETDRERERENNAPRHMRCNEERRRTQREATWWRSVKKKARVGGEGRGEVDAFRVKRGQERKGGGGQEWQG